MAAPNIGGGTSLNEGEDMKITKTPIPSVGGILYYPLLFVG